LVKFLPQPSLEAGFRFQENHPGGLNSLLVFLNLLVGGFGPRTSQKSGQDYYNRKGSYGIATLLICDKNKKIQYVYTGWPGCAHDQKLKNNCSLTLSPHAFFSQGQYFLVDSAFSATIHIVPAFKRTRDKQKSCH
ncbi:uncharacterized protein VP01_9661g1, partial [Puccinia sorghi]